MYCNFLDKGLYAFGDNDQGQLGSSNEDRDNMLPVEVEFFKDKAIQKIYSYDKFSFVLTGKLY